MENNKLKTKNIIIGILLIIIAVILYLWLGNSGKNTNADNNTSEQTTEKGKKVLYYRAPMNPNETYDKPGKSRMGMDLVPVYEDEGSTEGTVTIDGSIQQNMNVQTAVVENKDLTAQVITNGILRTDEQKEYIVTTKVSGWVEKLYVNYTGQKVKKGQKLIDIYSPELVAAQQELITAISYGASVSKSSEQSIANSGQELINNSIRKLELLDIPDTEIERIKKTKEIKKYITLYAPFDGTVIQKNIIEGQKINAGVSLLDIANLNNLWLTADIYEYELAKIKLGSSAEISYSFLPGKKFNSKISFIYPTIDEKTRTVKVRFNIPNYNDQLMPSMFANIVINGRNLGNHPVVPEQAVIRSGQKNIIILVLGSGKFKPVEVKLGDYSNGYYQVLDGVMAGDNIVTSSQFLIDSESSLRAAFTQFSNEPSKDTKKQEPGKDDKAEMNGTDMKSTDKKGTEMKKNDEIDDPRIRKGVIDLQAIDKNKDGKLFEDIMDWNVISDEPGTCPICGMTFKEFTIKEVKENLTEHGYKYKK
jgi:Cu(I)/Ag(I) efflux system membrane fusion protein/cobalt-zinc-cadmium efflux system membrane fusion protein